ncbi:hypothetical protein FHX49_000371 [Microbacterium endophyticum]|uniref:DUF5343 domain-containing protein n=1 Tax=Microbacterium endophyticum TaxID=1526412 RepID=A0A7W4YKW1_9MICO|nr:DUF5343 domain-containing protein [Microbacterium endophyticum]MBB2974830.1 hypothetical protein [Microbacterium endophyticum]NIK37127.1 hypothetical protein [Microbacterium endophyticum]
MADDASSKVPYLQAHGNLKKALEKIINATVPPKFTQDFLATTLDLPGGGARPVIPFLKRAGFLGSDGTPTEVYKQFRNPSLRGGAAAQGLRNAYADLYTANEYVHDANDKDLKGLIVQVTGLNADSKLIPSMVASFKTLREYADFNGGNGAPSQSSTEGEGPNAEIPLHLGNGAESGHGNEIQLGYTIHLNLPATSDIAVFNAIFKSLKENLL